MDLAQAIANALERIEAECESRLRRPVSVPVNGGGTAFVNADERARSKWQALDSRRDKMTGWGLYPLTLDAPDGSFYQLADAAQVEAVADALFLAGLQHEGAATQAKAAVLQASTVEAVDAALAAYLGS